MVATWNEFQKELRNRNIDPQNAFLFSMIYERLAQVSQEVDQMASVVLNFAQLLEKFTDLREKDLQAVQHLMQRGKTEGVTVESIASDPNDA